jgi:very-short-patch-repair endonuclease
MKGGSGPNTGNEGARSHSWPLSCRMGDKGAKSEEVIAKIAARQHGVVSAVQLHRAGISNTAAAKRAQSGRLHRIHRGVYALAHPKLTFEGRCMAAVLALGDRGVVSHRSAAAIWGMLPPHGGSVQVTAVGGGGKKKRSGVKIHRSHTLIARITTRRNGIPVTKPARTLRDLRRVVPQPVFRAAVRRALDLRLIRSTGLSEAALTRSELERSFLALCRRHRFPQPEVNARLGPYEVDFLWRDRRLVVETDGYRHHGGRAAFETDRARDSHLQSRGFRVLRFTYRQVAERIAVVAALRPLVGQSPLAPNL